MNWLIRVLFNSYRVGKQIVVFTMGQRESRPWVVTSFIFLALTFMYWSQVQITVRFLNLERPAILNSLDNSALVSYTQTPRPLITYNAQNKTASLAATPAPTPAPPPAIPKPQALPYATPINIFPTANHSKNPSANVTTLLESDTARKLQDQIIPKEGSKSSYGLTFNLASFNQMKQWDKSINPADSWKDSFDHITKTVFHPCCDAPIGTKYCGCGHAIALEGLTKKMLADGKSEEQVRAELLQWDEYFFPRHFVIVGLALQKMGKDANTIGDDANYGSIAVERYATDYLIY